MTGSRPIGVGILTVVIVLGGIFAILAGIVAILDFGDGAGLVSALILLLVGLVYLLVAKGLWNGSGGARLVVAIVTALSLLNGIWLLVTSEGPERVSGLGSIIVAVIILAILYSRRASVFFR